MSYIYVSCKWSELPEVRGRLSFDSCGRRRYFCVRTSLIVLHACCWALQCYFDHTVILSSSSRHGVYWVERWNQVSMTRSHTQRWCCVALTHCKHRPLAGTTSGLAVSFGRLIQVCWPRCWQQERESINASYSTDELYDIKINSRQRRLQGMVALGFGWRWGGVEVELVLWMVLALRVRVGLGFC